MQVIPIFHNKVHASVMYILIINCEYTAEILKHLKAQIAEKNASV